MNRTAIFVFLFLTLVLSCGNAPVHPEFKGEKPSGNALSREERVISGKLDALFTVLNQRGHFNGSVLIAKAGKIIYHKSHGYADKKEKILLSDSSMFQLASVSKVITATAVLLLHERKMLDINKSFSSYFPDFPYPSITIRDLLNHHSGLPNYIHLLNSEICRPNYRMNNSEMYESMFSRNMRLICRPGSRFDYCNTNYALLAMLVEKVSGVSFSGFLKEELFKPLGMSHTATIRDIDLDAPYTTRPYDNRWRKIGFDASDYVLGDKSIYSTAYDLFLFSEAMYNNRIISPETQGMAYSVNCRDRRHSSYGYGWRLLNCEDPARKEVYHNGWWHGYRTAFHRRLSDTLTVVILSNQLNRLVYQTQKVYQIIDSNTKETVAEEDDD
jgi:CubicO group peptidase (beta-lactamase class C family)